MSPLVLLPAEAGSVLEEGRGKENLISPRSSSGSKIVFILLTEVVAVYMGLSAIYVQGTGLQWLFLGLLGAGRSWGRSESKSSSLQNGLKNPLQVILRIFGDISSSGRRLWPWGSIGLLGKLWLGGWRRVKGSNGRTLPPRMIAILDWGHHDADLLLKHSSKRASWPIGYGEIRIVKGRSLIPDLVMCYSRDAQHDWIECLRLRSCEQKCGILKGCVNDFSQRKKIKVTWNVGIG